MATQMTSLPTIRPTTEAAAIADLNAQVVSIWGFTRGQLHEVFNMVTDPSDWRGPISGWVPATQVVMVVEAVKFFTATNPKVSFDCITMQCLVTSEGYRNGPAGS